MKIYYNITHQCLVDGFNCQVNSKPVLFFGEKPVWELQLYQGEVGFAPERANLSHVVSWCSAVDTDWDLASEPMCRTTTGIDISELSEGLLGIPMNANTVSFRDKLNGKRSCNGFWEVRGYDCTGNVVIVMIINIVCHSTIDHDGKDALDEPADNIATKVWTNAMLSAKADAVSVYTKSEIDSMLGDVEQQLGGI